MKKKIWLFFELDCTRFTTTLRGVALNLEVKKAFERSLTDEMKSRNKGSKKDFQWTVEESEANHLYGNSMYTPASVRWRGRKELEGE